jgi:hypothetical protein
MKNAVVNCHQSCGVRSGEKSLDKILIRWHLLPSTLALKRSKQPPGIRSLRRCFNWRAPMFQTMGRFEQAQPVWCDHAHTSTFNGAPVFALGRALCPTRPLPATADLSYHQVLRQGACNPRCYYAQRFTSVHAAEHERPHTCPDVRPSQKVTIPALGLQVRLHPPVRMAGTRDISPR